MSMNECEWLGDVALEHDFVGANGLQFHVVKAGPHDGPLVLLLHGFPEFWYGWRHQIPRLSSAGFRVWAPDQRGYNLSDKPGGIAPYAVDHLADDVLGLIDAAGREQVHLVGHDWGAVVAWRVARLFPERLQRLVVLNGPHSSVMEEQLRENAAQLRRSWYMFFFQLPFLPELALAGCGWQVALEILRSTSRSSTYKEYELKLYRRAWSRPRAMSSMINWYRALRIRSARQAPRRISVPTLMIWGANDIALGQELAQPSVDYCDDGQLIMLEDATHWVQHDRSETVNQLLVDFLTKDTARQGEAD
jgi:pimeloyl-ACP methyl ester carboxylesterase